MNLTFLFWLLMFLLLVLLGWAFFFAKFTNISNMFEGAVLLCYGAISGGLAIKAYKP